MSSVGATDATNPLAGINTTASDGSLRVPTKMLDQNDFLKLLVTQLANQDPTQPQDNAEFVSQMTQFTTLQQSKDMQTDISQMRAQQAVLQGMGLIDHAVIVKHGDSDPVTGIVQSVEIDGQSVQIKVGDKLYGLDEIQEVLPDQQNAIAN